MTARSRAAADRARAERALSATEEYAAGYRFGQAWLLTDEGREWSIGTSPISPIPALRRLAADRGRDYLRGFYHAVMGRPADPSLQRSAATDTRAGPRQRGRARPITVSVTLSTEEYAAIKSLQMTDGIPTATRIRSLILAYTGDAGIRAAIDAGLA